MAGRSVIWREESSARNNPIVAATPRHPEGGSLLDRKSEKVVGILGGMGPAATLDLLAGILRHTPAAKDQDHLCILVDMNPNVPDRVAALLEGGADPGPVLVEMARGLERAGARAGHPLQHCPLLAQ